MYLHPANANVGMGFDFSSITSKIAEMSKSIVSKLAESLPTIAVSTLSAVTVAKLSEKLGATSGDSGGGGGKAKPAAQPAPTAVAQPEAMPAVPQESLVPPTGAITKKSALPGWLIPAGIGVGAVVVVAIMRPRGAKGKRK